MMTTVAWCRLGCLASPEACCIEQVTTSIDGEHRQPWRLSHTCRVSAQGLAYACSLLNVLDVVETAYRDH